MVTTSFDGAGRPSGVSGVLNSVTTPYASGITYAAHGGLAGNRNHWTLADPAGYDGAGNMIAGNSASITQKALGYDAESRMTSWQATTNSVTTQVTFTYDGDGRRVTKTTTAGTTVYVYDPAGNLAAEYGGAASAVSGTVYLTQDQLGSTRLVTNAANGQPQAVGCHDYLPFGEEIPAAWGRSAAPCYGQTGDTSIKFTGQERDSETGLDNFLARHMAGAQGRFLSPDPENAGADSADPQSWNMYAYITNTPLAYVDPTGMFSEVPPDLAPWWDCRSLLNSGVFCVGFQPIDPCANGACVLAPPKLPGLIFRAQATAKAPRPKWLNNIASVFGYDQDDPRPSCAMIAWKTAIGDLNPFGPSAGEAANNFASQTAYNKALQYAMKRRLIKPFHGNAKNFRNLLKVRGGAWVGVFANLDYGLLDGLQDEWRALQNGACQ